MEAKLLEAGVPERNLSGWQEKYLQPVVIALVILAMFSGPVVLLEIIFPNAPWQSLPWLILLVSAEGILTTRWLHVTERKVNKFIYRVAEIIVILLFLRLFTWLFVIDLPGISDIESFLFAPSTFVDPVFFAYSFILFFVWQQTISMTDIFTRLQLDFEELRYYSKTGHDRYQLERPLTKNRKALRDDFIKQWVTGGLITGAFATLTTFDLSAVAVGAAEVRTIGRLGMQPSMLAALLVYFVGGLWLAGQGQLAVLRSRWLVQDTQLDRSMSRTWNRASVILIGLIATIAAFLPIGSTFAISRIVHLITVAVVVVINFIFVLISAIIFLIAAIFLRPEEQATNEPFNLSEAVPEQLLFEPVDPPSPSPIFGGIFWLIVIITVIAALLFFLRGRGVSVSGGKVTTFLSDAWLRLRAWFLSLWRDLRQQVQQLEKTIRERLQTAENPAAGFISFNRPGFRSLSPREKVRYYYLSVVRRAEEKGVERGKSETPSEFAADLIREWPEADSEVEALTDAFVKARYSPQPMTGDDLGPVKELWNRIKFAIRRRKS